MNRIHIPLRAICVFLLRNKILYFVNKELFKHLLFATLS